MSKMIRKQIYIHRWQQTLLDRVAKASGLSQAEIIRRAIEHEVAGAEAPSRRSDRGAWDALMDVVRARRELGPLGPAYRWQRGDAYQERERRFDGTPGSDPG
jgi:hypothetical protein